MCLTIKKEDEAVVAIADIVCWKFLDIKTDGRMITPYRDFPVELGCSYKSELVREYDEIHVGLHSFSNFKSASEYLCSGRTIVRCVIPKGSKYFTGEFDRNGDSYASDTLKYVCAVDKNGNDIIVKKSVGDKIKKFFKIK